MQILVVNHSTIVTDAQARLMAAACGSQLIHDVAPQWGVQPVAVRWADAQHVAAAGEYPIYLFDHADQAGALGYHSEDPHGKFYGKVFVAETLGGATGELAILHGPSSVTSVLSHEVCELFGDPACNRWADAPDGNSYAMELCDAVEGDVYSVGVNGVALSVSNFVLPAWFDGRPGNTTHFDHMSKLRAPFTLSPGGYTVYRGYGPEQQAFASVRLGAGRATPLAATKAHPASRTQRRMR